MTTLNRWKLNFAACLVLALTTAAAPAQTYTTLVDFYGGNGQSPRTAPLVQGTDGNFYGTTSSGGDYTGCNDDGFGCGSVFKTTAQGALTTLYSFCAQANCTDGIAPEAGLVLATDGNFYGTTSSGGSGGTACAEEGGCGTVFRISHDGKFTMLHSFDGSDGATPNQLIQASDGNLYGTTVYGGAGGSIFRMTLAGVMTTIYTFCAQPNCSDGEFPQAGLIQATDGNLYGTTTDGGGTGCVFDSGCGTVFKITLAGALTTLHVFDYTDGFVANGLTQALDGNFYGTTNGGGTGCEEDNGCGTAFRMTPDGTLTTLIKFNGGDGVGPLGDLLQATDGSLYGTTYDGGMGCLDGCGTAFRISSAGKFASYDFVEAFGAFPSGKLLQATNGGFYGMTAGGGRYSLGTVFGASTGLGPFVAFVRNPARIGQQFGILGQGFTGTTNVTLNGSAVSFTVKSDTFILATVPAGATTGYVTVTTPGSTLKSNVPFHVIP
jgi:uncharacterized repeat protein (TIGR03803 family)